MRLFGLPESTSCSPIHEGKFDRRQNRESSHGVDHTENIGEQLALSTLADATIAEWLISLPYYQTRTLADVTLTLAEIISACIRVLSAYVRALTGANHCSEFTTKSQKNSTIPPCASVPASLKRDNCRLREKILHILYPLRCQMRFTPSILLR